MVHRHDRITLAGIKLFPRIGTTPDERSVPQECLADLTVWGDFEAAASTDSLEKSVDYTSILSLAQRIAGEREYNLVETLAYRIVRTVLQSFPASRVSIKVRKHPKILGDVIDFVEIEVEDS